MSHVFPSVVVDGDSSEKAVVRRERRGDGDPVLGDRAFGFGIHGATRFWDDAAWTAVASGSSSSEAGPGGEKRRAEAAGLDKGKNIRKKPGGLSFPLIGNLDDLTTVPPPRTWPPARRERRKEGIVCRPAKRARGEGLPRQYTQQDGVGAKSCPVRLAERVSTRV